MESLGCWWIQNAPGLATGCLASTAIGAAAVAMAREPWTRRRTAEWTLWTTLLWLLLALAPGWRATSIQARPSAAPITAAAPIAAAALADAISAPAFSTQQVSVDVAPLTAAPPSEAAPRADRVPTSPRGGESVCPNRLAYPTPPPTRSLQPRSGCSDTLGGCILDFVTASESARQWSQGVGMLFALGAAAAAVYLLLAMAGLRRLLRRARPAPREVLTLARALPNAIAGVRILVSADVERPFCCGLRRRTIVLPGHCSDAGLRAVLMHEFAHLRNGDLRGQALFAVALPLLYWNPVYWWLRREARLTAELLADDAASRHVGRETYVRELVRLVERASRPRRGTGIATLAVFGQESEFFRRMQMLIQRSVPLASGSSPWQRNARRAGSALVAVLFAWLWGASALPAQDPAPRAPTAPNASTRPAPAAPTPAEPQARLTADVTMQCRDFAELGRWMAAAVQCGVDASLVGAEVLGDGRVQVAVRMVGPTDALAPANVQAIAPEVSITSYRPRAGSGAKRAPAPAPPAAQVFFAFEDTDIREVITACVKAGGLSVVVAPEVQGTITAMVRGVTAEQALRSTVETLGYQVAEDDAKVLRITAIRR